MKLAILNELFKAENPTGSVVRNSRRGQNWFTVWFTSNSKGYSYNATSVFALAERLDLIPEIDIQIEAKRIVAALSNRDEIIAPAGCGDTCRYSWKNDGMIVEDCAGVDEYDRALSRYYLDYDDSWGCSR